MFSISFSAIAYMPEGAVNFGKTFETESEAIDFLEDWYIYLAPDEQKTIKVLQDEQDITIDFVEQIKDNLRAYGWAVDWGEGK